MPYSERYGFIEDIGEKTNNRCHICHEEAHPDDYGSSAGPLGRDATTVDHIVPQSEDGDDHPDNLLLSHAGCNSSRGTRPVEEARLEHAGTTEKPLSTGEKAALEVHRQELAQAEARQRRVQALGIAAAIVGIGVAIGWGVWRLLRGRKKELAQAEASQNLSGTAGSTHDGPTRLAETQPHAVSDSDPSQVVQTMNQQHTTSPQIDRQTFEQALLDYLRGRGERPGTQQSMLSKLDEAELVTVRGEGLEGLEVWIPGWDDLLGGEVRAQQLVFGDVTLQVAAPDPHGQSTSEWRMDVVERRPLFPKS